MSNPRDLFLQRLGELLWLERMLVFEALPELQEKIESQELSHAVAQHLEQTREHVARCERAFLAVGAEPSSAAMPVLDALRRDHDELAGNVVEPHLADVFHAAAAAQVEHLELAGYETVLTLARAMGADAAAELLEANHREEQSALELLRAEAERIVQEVPR